MNKPNLIHSIEKAQVIPIVVFAMIVMILFAALIIDGGSLMVNRRTAQAAADAGAMAGARELCYPTGSDPLVIAQNYVTANGGTPVNLQLVNDLIHVEATVSNDSFFSKIMNNDSLEAGAVAEAGCFSVLGNYLMPIAWSCRPSLSDTPPFDPGKDCLMMALDWADLLQPLVEGDVTSIQIPGNVGDFEMEYDSIVEMTTGRPPNQIYLVMDNVSTSEDTFCKESLDPSDPNYDVAITCDLDGDGKNDIEGGGNRGWLDLNNGGGGAADLKHWIENGLDFPISEHTWLSGQTGVITSVFESIKDYRVGDVVLIPVFNAICDDTNPIANTVCMEAAHAAPLPPEPATGDIDEAGPKPKFHVIAFNPFYISCVHTFSFDDCPGFSLAQEVNPDPKNPNKSLIPDNTASVEGFFLTNVEFPLDLENHCSLNLGNCVISLTK